MRTATAYFAGAGTVIAAIVGGVGGGLLIADMVSPKSPKVEMTRLEQRMTSQPIRAEAAPQETVPVPYLAAPSPAAVANVAAPSAQPVQAQTETTNPPPPAAPAETVAAAPPAAPATQSQTSPSQPVVQKPAAVGPEPQKQVAGAPEDAQAKAKDDDLKRAGAERRKVERRERWAERRRQVRRPDRELLEVEQRVREETEPRALFAAEPERTQMPRIRLFDADQD